MVIVSIEAATVDAAVADIERAPAPGLVELRADRLSAAEVSETVSRSERELIVTVRSCAQGGRFAGDRDEWLARTNAALEAGARYVDVEWTRAGSDPLAGLEIDDPVDEEHRVAVRQELHQSGDIRDRPSGAPDVRPDGSGQGHVPRVTRAVRHDTGLKPATQEREVTHEIPDLVSEELVLEA